MLGWTDDGQPMENVARYVLTTKYPSVWSAPGQLKISVGNHSMEYFLGVS